MSQAKRAFDELELLVDSLIAKARRFDGSIDEAVLANVLLDKFTALTLSLSRTLDGAALNRLKKDALRQKAAPKV